MESGIYIYVRRINTEFPMATDVAQLVLILDENPYGMAIVPISIRFKCCLNWF